MFATTRGEFAEFVADTGYKTSDERSQNKDDRCFAWAPDPKTQSVSKTAKYLLGAITGMQLGEYPNWRAPEIAQDDRHPVVCIAWTDAAAYVTWLSKRTGKKYRLLTEAEWEYVARAGTTTSFWWGNSISSSQANYDGRTAFNGGPAGEWRQTTLPVDSFQPNPWGLYQVHGNVSEWVADCWNGDYGSGYRGAPNDGRAWNSGSCSDHVMRNGGWVTGPGLQRAAARFPYSRPANILGFRVARTL
jgi:formylglycine-generating enzyme required for sulfatase activity